MAHKKYGKAAEEAHKAAEHETTVGRHHLRVPQNAELMLFLHFVVEEVLNNEGEAGKHWAQTVKKAVKAVQAAPTRIWNERILRAQKHIGPSLCKVVADNLWQVYPPGEPDEDDLAADEAVKQSALEREAQAKADQREKRRQKAEEKAFTNGIRNGTSGGGSSQGNAAGGSGGGSGGQDAGPSSGVGGGGAAPVPPQRSGVVDFDAPPSALYGNGRDDPVGGSKKMRKSSEDGPAAAKPPKPPKAPKAPKPPKGPKEYVPACGTANYALLITLYMELKRGNVEFLLKNELLEAAEKTGLCNTSLSGEGNPQRTVGRDQSFLFTGWSSFTKSCINRDPPLAIKYSSPAKIRLAHPHGVSLAARLFKDALARGKVTSLPDGVNVDADANLLAPAGSGIAEPPAYAPATANPPPAANPPSSSSPEPAERIELDISSSSSDEEDETGAGIPPPRTSQPYSTSGGGSSGAGGSGAGGGACAARASQPYSTGGGDTDGGGGGCGLLFERKSQPYGFVVDPPMATQNSEAPPAGTAGATTGKRSASDAGVGTGSGGAGPSNAKRTANDSAGAAGHGRGTAGGTGGAGGGTGPSSGGTGGAGGGAGPAAGARGSGGSAGAGPSRPARDSGGGSQNMDRSGSGAMMGDEGSSSSATMRSWLMPVLGPQAAEYDDCFLRLPPLRPGSTFGQEYQVLLLLDSREQFRHNGGPRSELAERNAAKIRRPGVAVEVVHLPIGDVVWVARRKDNLQVMYVLDFILERKQADDLSKSILDGRYNQQKYWLRRCGLMRPMYLVEGDLNLMNCDVDSKRCKTAAVNCESDGFTVLRTAQSDQTHQLYQQLTRAITQAYEGRRATGSSGSAAAAAPAALETYDAWSTRVKKMQSERTVRDVWGCMLCLVPGVSDGKGEAILAHYPTPISLWRAYRDVMQQALSRGEHAVSAAQKLLMELKQPSDAQRVGPSVSKSVYDNLFASGWDLTKC